MKKIISIILFCIFISDCTKSEAPFLQLSVCLENKDGVGNFIKLMNDIAVENKMKFMNSSALVKKGLEGVSKNIKGDQSDMSSMYNDPVIDLSVRNKDGSGLSAGNVGLPDFQVAIGFSKGRDAQRATNFAAQVKARMATLWRTEEVPSTEGVLPMEDCR